MTTMPRRRSDAGRKSSWGGITTTVVASCNGCRIVTTAGVGSDERLGRGLGVGNLCTITAVTISLLEIVKFANEFGPALGHRAFMMHGRIKTRAFGGGR